MNLLYLTADRPGTNAGGALVTFHEREALRELALERGEECFDVTDVPMPEDGPFQQDRLMLGRLKQTLKGCRVFPKLAHLYSGCTPDTVAFLKENACKVSYTIAAHDREISRREHESLGLAFPYPHLTEPHLWNKYIHGYRLADVIVCPGSAPGLTVRGYGPDFAQKRIEIIPHGCELPEKVAPFPRQFTVGYLGSFGPDKGVRYLLEAWKKFNYQKGLLILAGRDSTSPFAQHLARQFGGGNIQLAGWQKDVSAFYNSLTLFVCPAATEGFNIEVLEAMAHGRPVICSDEAGAADIVPHPPERFGKGGYQFKAGDTDDLWSKIADFSPLQDGEPAGAGILCREAAVNYTWAKIRERYKTLWRELLA